MNSLGAVIKEIRKNRKLTQKMLSEDICSQSVLSRIENNEELPNVLVMQQLCDRLGVTVDQIMRYKSGDVHVVTYSFEKMAEYFRHKKYQLLLNYLKENRLEEQLYLDTDWQKYYYYLGSCELFVLNDYEKAIASLRKGLSFTYKADKLNVSDLEIQLISCLGATYGYMGNRVEAERFLSLSIHYFNQLPNERSNAELTKIFFNYADFLFKNYTEKDAEIYVDQGITWARKKNSYYYLSELLNLKYLVLMRKNKHEEAERYLNLAQQMKNVESGNL
ncbi:helix-turn-helix domain-containing protein [Enterococcus faecalis]|uniref:helix-turn-helix domain-containing protein n=1 Tax=Enterococcus faecalis TaxID=1351 RepID=UPI001F5A45B5|nr:helix-turn-helix transcriptional regulator [Enterococcus faecalis]